MNPRRVAVVAVAVLVLWVAVSGGVILHYVLPGIHRLSILAHGGRRYGPHAPIPTGPKAHTQAEFNATLRAFRHRMIVEAYKKSGVRNPRWDRSAVRFLEEFCELMMTRTASPLGQKAAADGRAVIALGCTDPLVESCVGMAIWGSPDAVELFEKSLKGFEKGAYSGYQARIVPNCLMHISTTSGKPISGAELKRLQDLEIRWTAQSLVDGSFKPGEDRIAVSRFQYNIGDLTKGDPMKDRWTDLSREIEKNGSKLPYAAKTMAGICHLCAYWESGVSRSTKSGVMLQKAREEFHAAWNLHPEYPEAPALLIYTSSLGKIGEDETPLTWFDRSVAGQMDYSQAYYQLMRTFLPRWGDLYDFGADCAKTRRYDTDVPMEFFRALQSITSDSEGDKHYWKLPETGRLLDEMFDGYAKSGHFGDRDQMLSGKAAAAWYCGRNSEARDILNGLGSRVRPDVFQSMFHVPYQNARNQIYGASRKTERM